MQLPHRLTLILLYFYPVGYKVSTLVCYIKLGYIVESSLVCVLQKSLVRIGLNWVWVPEVIGRILLSRSNGEVSRSAVWTYLTFTLLSNNIMSTWTSMSHSCKNWHTMLRDSYSSLTFHVAFCKLRVLLCLSIQFSLTSSSISEAHIPALFIVQCQCDIAYILFSESSVFCLLFVLGPFSLDVTLLYLLLCVFVCRHTWL